MYRRWKVCWGHEHHRWWHLTTSITAFTLRVKHLMARKAAAKLDPVEVIIRLCLVVHWLSRPIFQSHLTPKTAHSKAGYLWTWITRDSILLNSPYSVLGPNVLRRKYELIIHVSDPILEMVRSNGCSNVEGIRSKSDHLTWEEWGQRPTQYLGN